MFLESSFIEAGDLTFICDLVSGHGPVVSLIVLLIKPPFRAVVLESKENVNLLLIISSHLPIRQKRYKMSIPLEHKEFLVTLICL